MFSLLKKLLRKFICTHSGEVQKWDGGILGVYEVVRYCPRCKKKRKAKPVVIRK